MAHKSCSKKFSKKCLDTTDSDFDAELRGIDFSTRDLNEMEYDKRKKGRKKSFGRMSPDWYFGGRIEKRIFAKLADEEDFHPDHHRHIKYKGKAMKVFYR
jgi:hypothetical protein